MLVYRGNWAALWQADRGAALSLLPVLALLARGYGARGAFARRDTLREWSGLSARALDQARVTLSASGLIRFLPTASRGIWHFRLGIGVLGAGRAEGFNVPGRLIDSGLWAGLPKSARATLIAIACEVRPLIYGIEDPVDGEEEQEEDPDMTSRDLPGPVVAWLRRIGALVQHEDYDAVYVRRVGPASFSRLAHLTGLDRSSVFRAVDGASRVPYLLRVLRGRETSWYHLPDERWELGFGEPGAQA